ncbi:MAG: PIN domain-containing protein [Candidatus Levybacteria bacterium]|nr:PIN domain-containing protein [Candidatus Levybacteria bacterium]
MAILSKKVYLDSSVFVAFIDRAHIKYDQATAYFRYFALEEYQLFSDPYTLIDAYNRLYNDISPSLAKDFMRVMALSNITMVYPEESDVKNALKAIVNFKTTDLTYPKALLSVLANRRGVPQICSFDYMPALFGLSMFYLPI